MKRVGHAPVRLIAGLFVAAVYAMPQAYTISARPGAINYIEGTVSVNGKRVANDKTRPFLMTNDVLATDSQSRAEILLTPGIFLRVGENSEVKMVSPRLTDTQVEVAKGEAMVEIAEISKDNNIQIKDGAASVRLEKIGIYRFTANGEPSVQVLDGKAVVEENGRHIDLGKGKETALDADLKSVKLDKKSDQQDELYAWSKVRDEYVSAASYSSSRNIGLNTYSNGLYDGFGGFYGPGWMWNSGFNSWAWLPGDGAFFSPFGYGFYSPGVVGYAPVIYTGVGGGVYTGLRGPVAVPVNPVKPPAGVNPALIASNNSTQSGWHPGRWSGTVGNQPVGNAGHISSASIAAAHGSVGHAMSAGSSAGSSSGGGYSGGGYSGSAVSAGGHMSAMSAGGGGHASSSGGGGSHK